MTAPRWIAEALEAATERAHGGQVFPEIRFVRDDRLAAELLERMPIESITAAIRKRIVGVAGITGDWIGAIAGLAATGAIHAITGGDQDAVTIAELYQGACRELDAAGVPYAEPATIELVAGRTPLAGERVFDLAGRIRWLAQQRPTRLELKRVEAERDAARAELAELDEVLLAGGIARSLDRFQETPATLRKRVEHAVALAGLRKPGSD